MLTKGAKGLGVKCKSSLLSLVCSGGVVPDIPICGKSWTLGEYVRLNGGTQNRSKKVWGLLVPFDDEEENITPSSMDSVNN